jgi:hypothetical protein
MEKYFNNLPLLQNTLLSYFCEAEPLKLLNKQFYKLNYEKYNTHIQPHAIIETYHLKTRLIKLRETYKNGKLDGLYQEWWEEGLLEYRINYKNGDLNGLYEEWWDEDKLWVKCWYKNSLLNGLYEECNYKNNKIDDLIEEWYDDGQLKTRSNYI